MVMVTSLCPNTSWTVLISYPFSICAWRKNGVMNDMSPALLFPRCEQPLARLFVALIRDDDACSVVRLRGQRSISSPEKPIGISILDQRWDSSDPARWA